MVVSNKTLHDAPLDSVNYILKLCGINWRFGIVTKAWAEELDEGLGGIGTILLVYRESIQPEGERQPLWIIHPEVNKEYMELCGDPKGRFPLILNEAIEVPCIGE